MRQPSGQLLRLSCWPVSALGWQFDLVVFFTGLAATALRVLRVRLVLSALCRALRRAHPAPEVHLCRCDVLISRLASGAFSTTAGASACAACPIGVNLAAVVLLNPPWHGAGTSTAGTAATSASECVAALFVWDGGSNAANAGGQYGALGVAVSGVQRGCSIADC